MIVCHCRIVTDREIDAAIARGATDVCSLAAACGAGQSCGGCLPALCDRLEQCGVSADQELTAADVRRRLGVTPASAGA